MINIRYISVEKRRNDIYQHPKQNTIFKVDDSENGVVPQNWSQNLYTCIHMNTIAHISQAFARFNAFKKYKSIITDSVKNTSDNFGTSIYRPER